jgi:hypothetical protein
MPCLLALYEAECGRTCCAPQKMLEFLCGT